MNDVPAWHSKAPAKKTGKGGEARPKWAKAPKPKGKFVKPHKGNPNPRKPRVTGNPYHMIEAPDAGLRRMLGVPPKIDAPGIVGKEQAERRANRGLLDMIERKRVLMGDDYEDDY